ncbi:hypothetical protein EMPS_01892 [Entomortierella parvispora]|uniref:Uncharacterized protein n=1 Tax=Entomortierella parvispora TaxID=205924 RepID=A0A9P3H3P6_9FUNG|nr:hypothetical protein EMPS_01892 [Entomortierella parvispora]
MATISVDRTQPSHPRLQRRRRGRSFLALVLLALFFSLLTVFHPVSAQDDDSDGGSDGNGGHADDPELTGTFPPLDDSTSVPLTPSPPPSPVTAPDDASPAALSPSATKTKIPKPTIALPTVLYVPPTAPNMNPNAIDPLFPLGSESCQKCKYFYPKLKECNQIAQQTLGCLPRYPPNNNASPPASSLMPPLPPPASSSSSSSSSGLMAAAPTSPTNLLSAAATATTSFSPATTTVTAAALTSNNNSTTTAPADFTTLMPFLQCICPSQGLAATKVCLTCFRITNQRNFLDQLVAQNVR